MEYLILKLYKQGFSEFMEQSFLCDNFDCTIVVGMKQYEPEQSYKSGVSDGSPLHQHIKPLMHAY